MTDPTDRPGQGDGGKHSRARQLVDKALRAADPAEADRLMEAAMRTDPQSVENALQEAAEALPSDVAPAADREVADETAPRPDERAPSRSGITGPGSGADSERR